MHRLLSVAMLALFAGTARAAISFGSSGVGPITFDALPDAAEWAGAAIAGDATSFSSVAALDAAVQTNTAARITSLLGTSSSTPPATGTSTRWSSTLQSVYTRPAGVGAVLLMATLRNDSGRDMDRLFISWEAATGAAAFEEIVGQRFYFSLTGAPGDWVPVEQLSGEPTSGIREALIDIGIWPAGSLLYLLWADDNGSQTDPYYAIDNFSARGPIVCDSFPWLQPFSDITVREGQPATFSISLCPGERYAFQWFKNNAAIPGATNAQIGFARTRTNDAGIYHAVLSNATGVIESRRATLTVIPDDEPARALLASQVEENEPTFDIIAVSFSEAIETNSAQAVTNYSLRGGMPESKLAVLDAFVADETNLVLHVENLSSGGLYYLTISNVTDRSSGRNVISPNPTALPVETFGAPLIAVAHAWRYVEAPTNTVWPGWTDPDYDDSAWLTGPGVFAFPPDERLPEGFVIQTMIRPPSAEGPITTYFRTRFNAPAWHTNAVIRLSGVFDDGAVVYLNGNEVWRVRLPPGPVTTSTFATNSTEPHRIERAPDISAADALRPGVNTLAVELHQGGVVNGDAVMGLVARLWQSPTVCFPRLTIGRSGAGAVSVSWSCGGTLQVASEIGGSSASWQDVVTQTNHFTTNATAGALFFRVRP